MARYFNVQKFPSTKEQITFERFVHEKTVKCPNGEVLAVKASSVIYRFFSDLLVYFVVAPHENELLVATAADAFCDVLHERHAALLDKKAFLSAYDEAVVLLDEIVDGGVIVEVDVGVLQRRIEAMKRTAASTSLFDNISQEKTLSGAFAAAKSQFAKSFLNR